MMLNEKKCNFIVFTRSKDDFSTRLFVNNTYLEKMNVSKVLGLWITEDLTCSRNCSEICKKNLLKTFNDHQTEICWGQPGGPKRGLCLIY